MADESPETIELDGRKFRVVSQAVTAAQDDYMLYWLGRADATDLLLELAAGVDSKARAQQLLQKILGSGHAAKIIAAVLTEEGKKWRREEADRNAEIFADITSADEKTLMRKVLVQFVVDFFRFGEASSRTSPKSSSPTKKDRATKSGGHGTSVRSAA
jgi:hypothetical protein